MQKTTLRRCGQILLVAFFLYHSMPLQAQQSPPGMKVSTDAGSVEKSVDTSNYIIGAGDVLYISLWKDEELTDQVLVLPDGYIVFPLVGELRAEGKTVSQLRGEIEKRIQRYVPDPVLTVMIQQVKSMQIYIVGKVNRPGNYPLDTNMNVLQAISAAGGLNAFARRNDIKIFRRRDGQTVIRPFKYDKVTDGKMLEQNIQLQRGDIIVVP